MQSSAFLTATNIVNLFIQAAFIILLGLAELYALILSEIDLSVGFVGAVGAAIALALIGSPADWPWWAGLIVGLAACLIIGAFQGVLITRLRIPSFVVTLAGLLGWQGVLIYVFDVDKGAVGGVISISNGVLNDLVSGSMTPVAGWIVLVVSVGLFALASILTTGRRRSQGLSAPPLGITVADHRRRRRRRHRARVHLQLEPGRSLAGEGCALGHPGPHHRSACFVVPPREDKDRALHVRHRCQP